MDVFAKRWYLSLRHAFYGKREGLGPVIKKITIPKHVNTLILTFYDETLPLLSSTWNHQLSDSLKGFLVYDGEEVLDDENIVSSEIISRNKVKLTFDKAVSDRARVYLGSWNDAVGKSVICDSFKPFTLPARAIYGHEITY